MIERCGSSSGNSDNKEVRPDLFIPGFGHHLRPIIIYLVSPLFVLEINISAYDIYRYRTLKEKHL